MTLHPIVPKGAGSGVLSVNGPEDMGAIRLPGVGGVICQRQLAEPVLHWLKTLPPDVLPAARVIVRPGEIASAVTLACEEAGLPDAPERRILIDDIAVLATTLGKITRAKWLRLRLDVVTTNACRRFHIDRVTARLVCTYRGTGTQYGVARDDAPKVVHTVPTGSPFVMRGTLWPAQPDPHLLHRSPPIEGTGETRLMLALDPVTDPDAET
ncbi:hypothetical protein FIU86_19870 [Roseovarius sp. THAF9]|uniref:DUF1826 domain-containing protein n=1 Tax=Roseovarius sp. THAF9 TaxID=2587847 RepID=UPI0012683546|nr:DUF1826 domain-containing protein [Roseovarius sp. THAF9]QFT95118.1 hypothetical protein FIU86_19870 [Roseovarius sp. THAF9]